MNRVILENDIECVTQSIVRFWELLYREPYDMVSLKRTYLEMMRSLRGLHQTNATVAKRLLEEVFCLHIYVRDISHGLGKREIFYMMTYELYSFFPFLSLSLYPILLEYYDPFPYGSWRDVVGVCQYIKTHDAVYHEQHPLIVQVLHYMTKRLHDETVYFKHHQKCDTNLVKWIPLENSKHDWIYNIIVQMWVDKLWKKSPLEFKSRFVLCGEKRGFRKMIGPMKASLQTVEYKMCHREWDTIQAKHVSKISLCRYWNALHGQNDEFLPMPDAHNRTLCRATIAHSLDSSYVSKYTHKRPRDLPFVFPQHLGKMVSHGMQLLEKARNHEVSNVRPQFLENMYNLNQMWKREIVSWKSKYDVHAYFPVLRLKHFLSSATSCSDIAKALLLFETMEDCEEGIYYDGYEASFVSLKQGEPFMNQLEKIVHSLENQIYPDSPTHFASSSKGNIPLFVEDGCVFNGDVKKYAGQRENKSFEEVFDLFGDLMYHPRYDFVRRRWHSIVQ